MGERISFWLRVLGAGVKPLDTVARWIAIAVLLLGVAGITVTLVLHLPWPLTVVILMGLLLVVVLEGAYRVWRETDQGRLSAEATRDVTYQELEAQRQTSERELAGTSRMATGAAFKPLEPRYDGSLRYRHQIGNVTEHRLGIRNPAPNPEATDVRLYWTGISPQPHVENERFRRATTPPLPVPRLTGGDPNVGISLSAGREEVWLIVSTATDGQGVMTAGPFSSKYYMGWCGTLWNFKPGDRLRLTYRIAADNLPAATFSIVITAEKGGIQCDLEG